MSATSKDVENKDDLDGEVPKDTNCVSTTESLSDKQNIVKAMDFEGSDKLCELRQKKTKDNEAPVLPVILKETNSRTNEDNVDFVDREASKISQPVQLEATEVTATESTKKENFLKKYLHEKCEGLSKRQLWILIVFGFVELFAAACIAVLAPFFPAEAAKKGASETESGIVFGCFELIVCISAPIFGYNMRRWNPKLVFNYGIYTTGVSCIIFGFLNYISNRHLFIFTCIVVRVIEALGNAAFVTSSFAIVALEFPNSVATTFATMETFYGVGAIIGPTLGGILYDVAGYSFPFLLMGGGLFATAVAAHYVLPNIENTTPDITQQAQQDKSEPFSLANVLKWVKGRYGIVLIPTIALVAFSVIAVTSGVGFLANTLQPHLKQELNITSGTAVGAIFILNGGTYALTAPFIGRLIDRSTNHKYFTIVGAALTAFGFLLLGPVPFLPFETSAWAICIGLIICGLGLAATLVSAFTQTLKEAVAYGYPDDLSTYGQVSGFCCYWTCGKVPFDSESGKDGQ